MPTSPLPSKRELRRRIDGEALGEHLQNKLRFGDPALGWEGDPRLTVAYNKLKRVYEVWRDSPTEDGKQILVGAQKRPDQPLIVEDVIKDLIAADTQRHTTDDILKAIDDSNSVVQKEIDTRTSERMQEGLTKAAFYLGKAQGIRHVW